MTLDFDKIFKFTILAVGLYLSFIYTQNTWMKKSRYTFHDDVIFDTYTGMIYYYERRNGVYYRSYHDYRSRNHEYIKTLP